MRTVELGFKRLFLMRSLSIFSSFLFLLTLLPSLAMAESFALFAIKKPAEAGKPDNRVQVYIPLGANCEPGEVDFAWGMNGGACIKTPNATLHCVTKKHLVEIRPIAGHKAACPAELPPGGKCYTKFITAEELSYIGKDPKKHPIVIRSEKSASTGKCRAAAYIDVGDKVVQLSMIDVKGMVHRQGMSSAVVSFSGISFVGNDGQVAASWPSANPNPREIAADTAGCGLHFGPAQQAPWPNFGKPQCPSGM
jgi:hypothetical protein